MTVADDTNAPKSDQVAAATKASWLGTTHVLGGKRYKLVAHCEEPDTGLCLLEEIGHPLGWTFKVPVAWIGTHTLESFLSTQRARAERISQRLGAALGRPVQKPSVDPDGLLNDLERAAVVKCERAVEQARRFFQQADSWQAAHDAAALALAWEAEERPDPIVLQRSLARFGYATRQIREPDTNDAAAEKPLASWLDHLYIDRSDRFVLSNEASEAIDHDDMVGTSRASWEVWRLRLANALGLVVPSAPEAAHAHDAHEARIASSSGSLRLRKASGIHRGRPTSSALSPSRQTTRSHAGASSTTLARRPRTGSGCSAISVARLCMRPAAVIGRRRSTTRSLAQPRA